MANVYEPEFEEATDDSGLRYRRQRVGEAAGSEHLGASVWELEPGESLVFHYHLGREELAVVLSGRPTLRNAARERELRPGDVVAFPRGPRGVHGFENRSDEPARVLLVSEMTGPNVSVYPDSGEIGIFDAPRPADRRFGARFRLRDARGGYGGGRPQP